MENSDTDQLNNSGLRISTSKQNFAETIFQIQKKKIEELINLKKLKEVEENSKKMYDSFELNKVIMFNDINLMENMNWEFSPFDVESFYNEDNPIIKSEWSESNINASIKGIEIKGLTFRSKDIILLENTHLEITTNFSLKGESSFWLMLRTEEYFDEFSAIIRISKEDNCQNIFISMGTYVRDSYKNLILKNFSKQQLIDFSKLKTKSYKENDSCDIRAYFLDSGDNKITAKIVVNDSKIENNINSEFFLPVFDQRSRLMIAGSGQQCCIKNLLCRINTKIKDDMYSDSKHYHSIFSNDKRNCDCCIIY